MFNLASILVLMISLGHVSAEYTCDTSLGKYYPYCINVPDNVKPGEKLPTLLFLSGSGARGPASDVRSLSGYDGIGKLVYRYNTGNRGDAETLAATQFISIIPISPKYDGGEVRHWWPQYIAALLDKLVGEYASIDTDRISLGGFSMGARGTYRVGTAMPERFSALFASGGSAEVKGDGTLSQQKADPVFDKLSTIAKLNVPVRQYSGAYDTTASPEGGKRTQSELVKLGDANVKIDIIDTDHSGMSIQPFNANLLKWLMQQKRSGAAGNNTASANITTNEISASSTGASSGIQASTTLSLNSTSGNVLFTPSVSGSTVTPTPKAACRQRRARRSDVADHSESEAEATPQRGLTLNNILARRAAHQASLEMAAHQAEAERRRVVASKEQAALVKRNTLTAEKVSLEPLAALKRHIQRTPAIPHAGVRLRRR